MSDPRVVSIVPYKILPARLGGEKGIAVFNEYVGQLVPLLAISTENNDTSHAKNYTVVNRLSNSRIRYINVFLYFTIRKLIRQHRATHLLIEHPYYGWLAWMIRRTTRITWVVHSHNIEFERSKSIGRWWWKALKWYERWVYRASDINFFISEDDRRYAMEELGIDAKKSHAITYGVEIPGVPPDRSASAALIRQKHMIGADEKILLFNGALYHHTNYDALRVILDTINPVLLRQAGLKYKILVCGKGLPDFFNELKDYSDKNVVYAGFVDDISVYFKATDLFLNPIISGGGVKTKAIEAIAYNCSVVSTTIGALGLVREVCGNKLSIVADLDWDSFTREVINKLQQQADTPVSFYEYYYWGNIARKVRRALSDGQVT
jgi:polysaccharide biosynthesis protein PslH